MNGASPQGITELLIAWRAGDRSAFEKLLPLVERELHQIAHRYMESIRFRGRSRNTPGPVISGDGRISSVYCDLPITHGIDRDQPHHLAALAGFQRDHTAHWRVDIRLEEILPQDQRVLPVCVGGRAAAPGEEYAGALEYLQRLDRHRHEFPFEALGKVAAAIGHWLDAGGGRQALGDLKELRQAAERVRAYQEFQPRRCDRREINRKLRAIGQEAAA